MPYICYILFSKTLDHYYIGYTSNIEERLIQHNNGQFGGKAYTCKTSDWELFLLIPCGTINQAIFIELKIKKMKSRKFIEDLKKHPELVAKLLNEFKN